MKIIVDKKGVKVDDNLIVYKMKAVEVINLEMIVEQICTHKKTFSFLSKNKFYKNI